MNPQLLVVLQLLRVLVLFSMLSCDCIHVLHVVAAFAFDFKSSGPVSNLSLIKRRLLRAALRAARGVQLFSTCKMSYQSPGLHFNILYTSCFLVSSTGISIASSELCRSLCRKRSNTLARLLISQTISQRPAIYAMEANLLWPN
jgi:hypothetical protein